MKVGLLARAEDRGLGVQTWEIHRNLRPARTLVVDVENPEGWPLHLDRFPGAEVVSLRQARWLPETACREWLHGLDVVVSCETFYDWRFVEWARDEGVATVCQVNPEFFLHDVDFGLPQPTAWWAPTTWRLESLPPSTRVVGVPVAVDRFAPEQRARAAGDRLRVLHVVGRPAYGDRNGTELMAKVARRLSDGVELTVTSQRASTFADAVVSDVADYWRLYDGHDVLAMPRRYGGLCLPVQEAMGAGLAVVMPSCSPNLDWPVVPAAWRYRGSLPVPAGQVQMAETDVPDLARVLNLLAEDRDALLGAQLAAERWASEHSWEAMLPLWRDELSRAVDALGSRV